MQTVALIDYDSGNVHSALRALRTAGEGAVEVVLTADPEIIARADRIVLPGVGHFAQCKGALDAKPGLVEALQNAVKRRAVPFLGICVGMQLMADFGAEDGETRGLGWIHGAVIGLEPGAGLVVPHMGWNVISPRLVHPVLDGLGADPHVYFVHSYAFSPEDEANIAATCEYGRDFVAAVANENMFGTQFHPEKSQTIGLQILSNFLNWNPK